MQGTQIKRTNNEDTKRERIDIPQNCMFAIEDDV